MGIFSLKRNLSYQAQSGIFQIHTVPKSLMQLYTRSFHHHHWCKQNMFQTLRKISMQCWKLTNWQTNTHHLWMGRRRFPHPQWDRSVVAREHWNTLNWLRPKHWSGFWSFPDSWKPSSKVHPLLPRSLLLSRQLRQGLKGLCPTQSGWNDPVASAYLGLSQVILNSER